MPEVDEEAEEVVLDLKPSRKRFIEQYSVAISSLIISVALFFLPIEIPVDIKFVEPKLLGASFLLVISFLFIAYVEIRRYVERYILTDTAVFEEIGLIDKRSTSLPYIKLERCDLEEPFVERAMDIGDVRVDAGQDFFILKGIPDPGKVRDLIRKNMQERMSGGNPAASSYD